MELNKPELLLKELKDSSFVPPYNSELIKKLKEDFGRIHNQIDCLKKVFQGEDGSDTKYRYSFMLTLVGVLKRILRCVLAYINHRLKKIKSAFWDYAGTIPEDKIKENLSEQEKTFYNEYRENIIAYQKSLPLQLDLLKDMEPPKSLFVEVRVMADIPAFVTEEGDIVKLDRGSTELVRRGDVEQLIKQGLIQLTGN